MKIRFDMKKKRKFSQKSNVTVFSSDIPSMILAGQSDIIMQETIYAKNLITQMRPEILIVKFNSHNITVASFFHFNHPPVQNQ